MAARFTRLPGTARNYRDNVTGIVYSRRQLDAIKRGIDEIRTIEGAKIKAPKGAAAPIKPMSGERLQQQRAAQHRYNAIVKDYKAKLKAEGKLLEKENVRSRKELKALLDELKKASKKQKAAKQGARESQSERDFRRYEKLSKKANNELRRVLEKMGRREGVPKWLPVGFSEKFRKGEIKTRADLPKKWR